MRGHESRRTASGINIPCAANIQARAVRRGQPRVYLDTVLGSSSSSSCSSSSSLGFFRFRGRGRGRGGTQSGPWLRTVSRCTRQPPVHDVTPAVRCHFGFHNFIFARQQNQRIRQFLPFRHGKTKPEKKPRLASASRVRRIEQIMRDLPFRSGTTANSALGNFICALVSIQSRRCSRCACKMRKAFTRARPDAFPIWQSAAANHAGCPSTRVSGQRRRSRE